MKSVHRLRVHVSHRQFPHKNSSKNNKYIYIHCRLRVKSEYILHTYIRAIKHSMTMMLLVSYKGDTDSVLKALDNINKLDECEAPRSSKIVMLSGCKSTVKICLLGVLSHIQLVGISNAFSSLEMKSTKTCHLQKPSLEQVPKNTQKDTKKEKKEKRKQQHAQMKAYQRRLKTQQKKHCKR